MDGYFRHALRMAGIYALFGVSWIFFSDRILLTLIQDLATLSLLQTYKGWLYVLVTAVLVFLLIRHSERRFRASEERFRVLVETSSDWIWEVNADAVYTYASPKVESLLGYQVKEVIGKTPFDFMPPEEAARVRAAFAPLAAGRLPFAGLINTNTHRDGHAVVLETSGEPVFDETGRWQGYRGIDRDITDRKRMEESLRQSAMVFENTREGVIITDLDATILDVNPAFCRITGYRKEELVGGNPKILRANLQAPSFYTKLWNTLLETGHWRGEIWIRRKEGEISPAWLSISTVHDHQGQAVRYVGVYTDIARLRESETQIEYLAQYDQLTDLPNRLLLQTRLELALEWARRHRTLVGLLFIDLDHFKHINESLGHPVGDELLVAVARRMAARLRPDDTLSRLGGDEFLLLLEPITEAGEATVVARDVLAVLSAPFHLAGGQTVYTEASIGISLFPDDGDTPAELLRNAEAAMYHAKNNGRNQLCLYAGDMNTGALARLELEAALRQALARRELLLHYQPKIDLRSGEMVGCEALIRWQRQGAGLIPPAQFIPLAEQNGQIIAIGAWVIDEVCRQMAAWRQAGIAAVRVAVNVSASQFRAGNLAAVVTEALQRHGIEPRHLELELTESMLMEHPEETVVMLGELKAIGITLSLDDFGTGYSSFAYLSRFPIDILKIDRSFIADIFSEPHAAMIANSIIALAHRMGLVVVAEGVETESQLEYLRRNGCDEMQGYYYSPPLAADDFAALQRQRKRLPLMEAGLRQERTLLIVDDEPRVLAAISRTLEVDGYRILTAGSGPEALEVLARNPVQVILSDERMPEMSGTEFLGRAKRLYPHTVRMVLTGYTELEAVARLVNQGAIYKFLTKPWEYDQLREQVRDAFDYHEAVIRPRMEESTPAADPRLLIDRQSSPR